MAKKTSRFFNSANPALTDVKLSKPKVISLDTEQPKIVSEPEPEKQPEPKAISKVVSTTPKADKKESKKDELKQPQQELKKNTVNTIEKYNTNNTFINTEKDSANQVKFTMNIPNELNLDLEGYAYYNFKDKQTVVLEALQSYLKRKEVRRLPEGVKFSKAGRKKR